MKMGSSESEAAISSPPPAARARRIVDYYASACQEAEDTDIKESEKIEYSDDADFNPIKIDAVPKKKKRGLRQKRFLKDVNNSQKSSRKENECSLCGKDFASSYHLNRHILTHTGKKQFQCFYCGKEFARKDKLKLHERRVHSTATLPMHKKKKGNFEHVKVLNTTTEKNNNNRVGSVFETINSIDDDADNTRKNDKDDEEEIVSVNNTSSNLINDDDDTQKDDKDDEEESVPVKNASSILIDDDDDDTQKDEVDDEEESVSVNTIPRYTIIKSNYGFTLNRATPTLPRMLRPLRPKLENSGLTRGGRLALRAAHKRTSAIMSRTGHIPHRRTGPGPGIRYSQQPGFPPSSSQRPYSKLSSMGVSHVQPATTSSRSALTMSIQSRMLRPIRPKLGNSGLSRGGGSRHIPHRRTVSGTGYSPVISHQPGLPSSPSQAPFSKLSSQGVSHVKKQSPATSSMSAVTMSTLASALHMLGVREGQKREVRYILTEEQIRALRLLGIDERGDVRNNSRIC